MKISYDSEIDAGYIRQIGVQTWLELEQRFDSVEVKRARKKLAQQLKSYSPNKHDKISETVLNFFESAGIACKSGCLDKKPPRWLLAYIHLALR
jgi:hypothetical protein